MMKLSVAWAIVLSLVIVFEPVLRAEEKPAPSATLAAFSSKFWEWRARYQPFSKDDIPRIERPALARDWSAAAIAKQESTLKGFETEWKEMDTKGWSLAQQVDYRLMGSALARVRWELEFNPRWQRDPTFYLDQSLTALLEALVQPPPFDSLRSRDICRRMSEIPAILAQGKANLRPLRPFAILAITSLRSIRPELERVERELAPLLSDGTTTDLPVMPELRQATENAILALESYRTWLEKGVATMPENAAVGRLNYEFFLREVALLPFSPEQLLTISREEWDRSVAFEQYEKQKNGALPELKLADNLQDEISHAQRDEVAIRKFLQDKGILTVPANIQHYTLRPMPGYLQELADFGELDDFTGPSRLKDDAVRWVVPPSADLGYFWLATAKDPRPEIVHEGIPGHYFQMCLSWQHPDSIRRHYYDSGANEGIGFYAEEMMLQTGLLDDNPRARETIYNFMRLRALRVEVDVRLALGTFTLPEAADYLARHVPMDRKTAEAEASLFATTPGQAISYQIGKSQILQFLADAKTFQGTNFNLQAFHDFLWKNGNVPIALQRKEYLGETNEHSDH